MAPEENGDALAGRQEEKRRISATTATAAATPVSLLSSAALIGLAALIEPELFVGLALGAGIVMASSWIAGTTGVVARPVGGLVGGVVRPVVRTAVKTGYTIAATASQLVAGATEEVQDMIAEARAEYKGQRAAGNP